MLLWSCMSMCLLLGASKTCDELSAVLSLRKTSLTASLCTMIIVCMETSRYLEVQAQRRQLGNDATSVSCGITRL